jgi:hypothetical protein
MILALPGIFKSLRRSSLTPTPGTIFSTCSAQTALNLCKLYLQLSVNFRKKYERNDGAPLNHDLWNVHSHARQDVREFYALRAEHGGQLDLPARARSSPDVQTARHHRLQIRLSFKYSC